MTESYYSNAMVEIALALAMAFFSIMVLAMVSMGVGFQDAPSSTASVAFDAIVVAPAASSSSARTRSGDTVVVHYQGRFFDAQLAPIDPNQIAGQDRVVLAIDPSLPMTDAIKLRAQVAAEDVIVTSLNERWLRALKEIQK